MTAKVFSAIFQAKDEMTKVFEKAYFIHLLQDMLEGGAAMAHIDTPGGYIEIDTQQDLDYARQYWISNHLSR